MTWERSKREVEINELKPDKYPLATVFRDSDGNKIIAADNDTVVELDDIR